MPPTTAKSLMKDFRASFRRKKGDSAPKIDKAKELEKDELAKLSELKEAIGESLCSKYKDPELLGFMRARSLNVKDAEKLVTLDYHMREFLMMDDFIKYHELSELNLKYSCSNVIGFDKEGSLIRVLNVGYSDIKGYIHCIATIENFRLFLLYFARDLLMIEEENKKTGKKSTQITYIANLENLGLSKVMYKPVIDAAIVALKLLQDHFHDTVKSVYVINAPSFYNTILKLFKPVIKDDLHKKIKIYEDGESSKEELLKHIDADVLPKCFGGNRMDSDGDETCKSLMKWGGTIPESFYSTDKLNPDDPDIICATVPAGASLSFRFYSSRKGLSFTWEIQAKENDIGIGLFLDENPTEEDMKCENQKPIKDLDLTQLIQLTPVIRSQCHICPEMGNSVTWFKGTVILHFDNTYSWMSSKEVTFKLFIETQ